MASHDLYRAYVGKLGGGNRRLLYQGSSSVQAFAAADMVARAIQFIDGSGETRVVQVLAKNRETDLDVTEVKNGRRVG